MLLWAQNFTLRNTIRCFVAIVRMVILKGANFFDKSAPFFIMVFYAFALNGVAVWSLRKSIKISFVKLREQSLLFLIQISNGGPTTSISSSENNFAPSSGVGWPLNVASFLKKSSILPEG